MNGCIDARLLLFFFKRQSHIVILESRLANMSRLLSLSHQVHAVELVCNSAKVITHTWLRQKVSLLLMLLRSVLLETCLQIVGQRIHHRIGVYHIVLVLPTEIMGVLSGVPAQRLLLIIHLQINF
jgi:hypothetical protein